MGKYTKKTVYTTRMTDSQILKTIEDYYNNTITTLNGKPFSQAVGTELDYNPENMSITVKPINCSDITRDPKLAELEDGTLNLVGAFERTDKDSHTIEWSVDLNMLYQRNIHRINNLYIEFDIIYNGISSCMENNVSNIDDGFDHLPDVLDPDYNPNPDDPDRDYDNENIKEATIQDIDNIFINGTSSSDEDDYVDNIFS